MVKFCTLNETVTGANGSDAPGEGLVIVRGAGRAGGLLIVAVTGEGLASEFVNSLSAAVTNFALT
jgi:hypothetical protein